MSNLPSDQMIQPGRGVCGQQADTGACPHLPGDCPPESLSRVGLPTSNQQLLQWLRTSARIRRDNDGDDSYAATQLDAAAIEIERLRAALKIATDELVQYIDLQQKSDYLEYAAESQKKLDAINKLVSGDSSAPETPKPSNLIADLRKIHSEIVDSDGHESEMMALVRRGFEEIERLEAQWRAEHDAYIDAEDEIECLVHDVEQLTKAVSAEATRAEQLRAALKEKEERLESWYRTEAQIRCALLGLIEEDVYLKAIELIGKKSTDHNPHLSGDSSAPETKATVELAADTIRALMERHNFRHPLMSELGDLIRETFRMGVDAGRCYHSPQETTVPHVADLATGKHPDWCRGCAAEKTSEEITPPHPGPSIEKAFARSPRVVSEKTSGDRCHFTAFRDPQFRCNKPAGHTDEHSCGLAPTIEPSQKASEQECRSAGPSGNAAGTGPVDTRAEARLSRREVTAQKASADCTGCGGKPEFPNIPCSICGRYPDGTSV